MGRGPVINQSDICLVGRYVSKSSPVTIEVAEEEKKNGGMVNSDSYDRRVPQST